MKVNIAEAILALEPTASFGVIDEDLDNIEWYSKDVTQPSKSDIQTKLDELQAIEDDKQYQRDRLAEYPSLQDCIHALLDGGDTLTDLQALRQAVKDKYPKE
tara:strand:- start:1539 stop:1844 length:306 start_codon:yes stop_codon:yes gene_type:complete